MPFVMDRDVDRTTRAVTAQGVHHQFKSAGVVMVDLGSEFIRACNCKPTKLAL
mgnify:CR=1 FL=1|jgi:hypothetical protein